jgi:hypothetical protein
MIKYTLIIQDTFDFIQREVSSFKDFIAKEQHVQICAPVQTKL